MRERGKNIPLLDCACWLWNTATLSLTADLKLTLFELVLDLVLSQVVCANNTRPSHYFLRPARISENPGLRGILHQAKLASAMFQARHWIRIATICDTAIRQRT
jgi:hypothetical protein